MNDDLSNKLEDMVKNAMQTNLTEDRSNWPFQSIEDYKEKTGKRFRMTTEQKQSGMTREQAFDAFVKAMVSKT